MTVTQAPRRVLLVSHYYPPHLGGIENVVRHEATGLVRSGREVVVLTTAVDGVGAAGTGPGRDEWDEGVRVVRVAAWNGFERRAGVPFPAPSPRILSEARRWARWADVVHVHECLYATSWAAGLGSVLARTPLVLTQHVALVEHPSPLVRGVQRAVYSTAGRALLRRAGTVFTLNATVADFVRRYGARAERLRHLPNGVDTELFRPAADEAERQRLRRELGLPADRVLVLFAGRLVPKKGFELLLAAAGAEYELVFAGDGDARALDGVPSARFLGTLKPEELARVYRACDVFALPSTGEGFPLTVQEAMASGLAVVTTDDPGYAPYGLDRELVRLVDRTPAAVRAALLELAADEGLRTRAGKYSRSCAEAGFSWASHVEALAEGYRSTTEGRV